jgi:hypothetical protein
MEKADALPPHDTFFCTADDTNALEPSWELIERFRPDLLPIASKGELKGHASLISNGNLKKSVGWEHRKGWRSFRAQP